MTAPLEVLSYVQSALTSGQTQAMLTTNPDGSYSLAVDIGPGATDLSMAALQGNEGAAGDPQFALIPMPDIYDSADDLPAAGVLTNTDADIGKYWIINIGDGSDDDPCTSVGAYIWFGTEFRFLPFGRQGPSGTYPVIMPMVSLYGPNHTPQISVNEGSDGSPSSPYVLTTELSIPEGPPGPCCPIAQMPDVTEGTFLNNGTPPEVGQFLTYTGESVDYGDQDLPLWAPAFTGTDLLMPYSIPAAAFTAQAGITFESVVTICTFTVPAKPWAWKPVVFGQIQVFEAELSLQPLLIGIEVMLGAPSGENATLVARGFGNTLNGCVTIVPHTSSSGSTSKAFTDVTITDTSAAPNGQLCTLGGFNDVGLVGANAAGTESTLYINLVNDGIVAIYDYNASQAEVFVLAVPVTEPTFRPQAAAMRMNVTLSVAVASIAIAYPAMPGKGALTAVAHSKKFTLATGARGRGALKAFAYKKFL